MSERFEKPWMQLDLLVLNLAGGWKKTKPLINAIN